jgi:ubiquinol-cytochrome c reductase cytochrome c1 subunit
MGRVGRALAAALFLGAFSLAPSFARAADAPPLPREEWPFYGIFGTYNEAALQRGFQVYEEVCATCHNLSHLHYADLAGIGYDPAQIKAFAARSQVLAGPNKEGKMYERPALPSDLFVGPFPNEEAAAAAFAGAVPPDLSMIVKAREGGPNYVYAILTGFTNPPRGFTLPAGTYYNKYFLGHRMHMPPALRPGAVKYADGTQASVPQMAHDVASFLTWASHPNLDERHRTGFKVILFLIVGAGVFYAAKRKIWSRIH